jgi:hypothetical protein
MLPVLQPPPAIQRRRAAKPYHPHNATQLETVTLVVRQHDSLRGEVGRSSTAWPTRADAEQAAAEVAAKSRYGTEIILIDGVSLDKLTIRQIAKLMVRRAANLTSRRSTFADALRGNVGHAATWDAKRDILPPGYVTSHADDRAILAEARILCDRYLKKRGYP